jgi:hypothetical protein
LIEAEDVRLKTSQELVVADKSMDVVKKRPSFDGNRKHTQPEEKRKNNVGKQAAHARIVTQTFYDGMWERFASW